MLRIENFACAKRSKIYAFAYIFQNGHIMLINKIPYQIMPIDPLVRNTQQWIVNVIDQTGSPHGKNDTRYINPNEKVTGLGSGNIRIYTDKHGELMGYSWSTSKYSPYIDKTLNKLIIARLS